MGFIRLMQAETGDTIGWASKRIKNLISVSPDLKCATVPFPHIVITTVEDGYSV